ncbi:MAG: hypothetical protein WCR42_12820 [bacterium]
MNQKTFDCVEMQRNLRDTLLKEANYNLKDLIQLIKENNKISPLFKQIIEKQEKAKQKAS